MTFSNVRFLASASERICYRTVFSLLERCTQLNYTLHSKYHIYILQEIRIEKSIIQDYTVHTYEYN